MSERLPQPVLPSRAREALATHRPVPLATPPLARPALSRERGAFGRVVGVAVGLAVAIAATYALPPLYALRPWAPGSGYVPFWNLVGREWLGEGEALRLEALQLAELQRRAAASPPSSTQPSPSRSFSPSPAPAPERPRAAVFPPYTKPRIEKPEYGLEPPDALDRYFRKLTLVDLGVEGAVARAGHWGDSVLGLDGITSGIRRRLQSRFGDAGHGFHMMDRYNPSYEQQGIEFVSGQGWDRCLIVFECSKEDRRYGYGGLIARSSGGAASEWSTTERGFGSSVSLFELWFAQQEQGGRMEVRIDREDRYVVDTRGPHLEDGWYLVSVPPGTHRFTVRALGGGNVRAYGVVLENDGPGVVWDGMALIGGSTRGLRTQNPKHIASQIKRRGLDLLVFLFGGNDMERNYVDLKTSMQPYYEEYGEVLKNFRAGRPEADCLIMSVTDHGERTADGSIVSRSFTKTLAEAQREVARRNGCAFFDTRAAMGGEGTVARWFRASPRLISPDLGHPTGLGHEVIAGLLANAIIHGYEEYRTRMEGKAFPELDPPVPPPAPQGQSAGSHVAPEGESPPAGGTANADD